MSKKTLTLEALRHKAMNGAPQRAHSQYQRKLADAPPPELQQKWFQSMKIVLGEIDEALKFIHTTVRLRFLDLGCCPGGFSSYILTKNPNATGVGISLNPDSGGHPFLLEEHLRHRLELHFADLTRYQLGPTYIHDPSLRLLPFHAKSEPFDTVLLDGHALRTYSPDTSQMRDILLVSQIIICLQTIARSGTIVMKLSQVQNSVTKKLLYMLDNISFSLGTWKPLYMHATRSTFYAVAKGVGYGRQKRRLPQLLRDFKLLWMGLKYDGGYGSGLRMEAADLDFIVQDWELQGPYKSRLNQLTEHISLAEELSMRSWQQSEGYVG